MNEHPIHYPNVAAYGWCDTVGRRGWWMRCTVCDWEEFYDSEAE